MWPKGAAGDGDVVETVTARRCRVRGGVLHLDGGGDRPAVVGVPEMAPFALRVRPGTLPARVAHHQGPRWRCVARRGRPAEAGRQSATRGHTQRAEAEPTSARLKIALIVRSVLASRLDGVVGFGTNPIPLPLTTERVVLLSSDGQGRAPAHRHVPEPQAG